MNIVVAAIVVFFVFGLMSMAGLGAATLFIPIFYYTGMPLPEAISTGLLLNIVALGFTVPAHVPARTINYRLAVPIALMAAVLAPSVPPCPVRPIGMFSLRCSRCSSSCPP